MINDLQLVIETYNYVYFSFAKQKLTGKNEKMKDIKNTESKSEDEDHYSTSTEMNESEDDDWLNESEDEDWLNEPDEHYLDCDCEICNKISESKNINKDKEDNDEDDDKIIKSDGLITKYNCLDREDTR